MDEKQIVLSDLIEDKIFLIRGLKVMVDADLADLYGMETKSLVRAVKRNLDRFPEDFMFQLNKAEFENLRYQFGTSNRRGGRRYLPFPFTEQGVAMLSSVLNSQKAIEVNIQIMRTFVKLREMITSHKGLARKLRDLEKKYDENFKIVFEAIRELMAPSRSPGGQRKRVGFQLREPKAA